MALRRWLVLGEETEMAHCPEWYVVLQAAKYLGVAPWDLITQSIFWRDKALVAIGAENGARKILQAHGLL